MRAFALWRTGWRSRMSNLILTRKADEIIWIGDDIKVTILAIKGTQCRISIDAPKDVVILRQEVKDRNEREARQ